MSKKTKWARLRHSVELHERRDDGLSTGDLPNQLNSSYAEEQDSYRGVA